MVGKIKTIQWAQHLERMHDKIMKTIEWKKLNEEGNASMKLEESINNSKDKQEKQLEKF